MPGFFEFGNIRIDLFFFISVFDKHFPHLCCFHQNLLRQKESSWIP